jgi:hypothetical protein
MHITVSVLISFGKFSAHYSRHHSPNDSQQIWCPPFSFLSFTHPSPFSTLIARFGSTPSKPEHLPSLHIIVAYLFPCIPFHRPISLLYIVCKTWCSPFPPCLPFQRTISLLCILCQIWGPPLYPCFSFLRTISLLFILRQIWCPPLPPCLPFHRAISLLNIVRHICCPPLLPCLPFHRTISLLCTSSAVRLPLISGLLSRQITLFSSTSPLTELSLFSSMIYRVFHGFGRSSHSPTRPICVPHLQGERKGVLSFTPIPSGPKNERQRQYTVTGNLEISAF